MIIGHPSAKLPMTPKLLTTNVALRNYDMSNESLFVDTTGGLTITLPTPVKSLVGITAKFLTTASAVSTLSCTSSIFPSLSSFTLEVGSVVDVTCVQTAQGTYKWVIQVGDVNPVTTFTPSLAWTTATPTLGTATYRKRIKGRWCEWLMDIAASDGKGATVLTLTFPTGMVPANTGMIIPVKCLFSVDNAAYTAAVATLDCSQATAGNRTLVITGTLTNAKVARVIASGAHELA